MAKQNLQKKIGDNFLLNIGNDRRVVDFLNAQGNRSLAVRFAIDLLVEQYGIFDLESLLPSSFDEYNASKYTVLFETVKETRGTPTSSMTNGIQQEIKPILIEEDFSKAEVGQHENNLQTNENIKNSPEDKKSDRDFERTTEKHEDVYSLEEEDNDIKNEDVPDWLK